MRGKYEGFQSRQTVAYCHAGLETKDDYAGEDQQ
jgi:hypothetical protein